MIKYLTVSDSCSFEFTEKKSRFIGTLMSVTDADQAAEIIAGFKKEYWDATHNCSAYIIGADKGLKRFSDDGEPQGTAGMPMLNALEKSGLTDVIVIATRYFGGTLLGAGGLVRAYTKCVTGAVEKARENGLICEMVPGRCYDIRVGYTEYQRLDAFLRNGSFERENTEFTDAVDLTVCVPLDETDKFEEDIREMFSGSVLPAAADEKYIIKTVK